MQTAFVKHDGYQLHAGPDLLRSGSAERNQEANPEP